MNSAVHQVRILDTLELPQCNFWFKCGIPVSTYDSFYERANRRYEVRFSGSHGGKYEHDSLLGYNIILSR
jgi:hypothetical protein